MYSQPNSPFSIYVLPTSPTKLAHPSSLNSSPTNQYLDVLSSCFRSNSQWDYWLNQVVNCTADWVSTYSYWPKWTIWWKYQKITSSHLQKYRAVWWGYNRRTQHLNSTISNGMDYLESASLEKINNWVPSSKTKKCWNFFLTIRKKWMKWNWKYLKELEIWVKTIPTICKLRHKVNRRIKRTIQLTKKRTVLKNRHSNSK